MKATCTTINALMNSLSETGEVLYTEMFQDLVLNKVINIDKGILNDFIQDKENFNELVFLDSNLSLILVSLCTVLRAELIAKNVMEKRFLQKRIILVCHEGYKYLFGFNEKHTPAIRFLDSINDKEKFSVDTIKTAANDYRKLYGTNTYKKIRDVSKHYSYDSFEFYDCIKDLNEQDVANLVVSFMVYIQPLQRLVSLNLSKLLGNEVNVLIRNLKVPEQAIPNIFNDQQLEQIGNSIVRCGNFIEKLNFIVSFGKNTLKKININDDNESLKPFLKDNIALHVVYIIMDVMCAFKAYSNSKYFYERSFHLAFINLSVHEGFKKLYGFNNDNKESFWSRIKEDFSSVSSFSEYKLNEITENLQKLASTKYVSSEDISIFTHYGINKNNNIPFSVLDFFTNIKEQDFFILIEVGKTLNSIFPLVFELMENKNQQDNEELEKKRNETIGSISQLRAKATPEMQQKLDELTQAINKIYDKI
jgi:hypothetical protein